MLNYLGIFVFATLAQLVERQFCKLDVPSSNLGGGSNMNRNKLVWLFLFIGSSIGGFIPTLWDSSFISMSGIFGSAIGGLIGIWIGWKIGE